jgi:uncharacterized tellurite resistance protein B-like protein
MSTEMTPIQNLHFAIGELAYSVACADGKVQREERERLLEIVNKEMEKGNYSFDISGIIFQLMDKDKSCSLGETYDSAMKQIRLNGHYLSPELKEKFIRIIERVAEAYPPVTSAEKQILERFRADIADIKGDPVYYGK